MTTPLSNEINVCRVDGTLLYPSTSGTLVYQALAGTLLYPAKSGTLFYQAKQGELAYQSVFGTLCYGEQADIFGRDMLTEDGFSILLESGDKILLE